MSKPNILCAEFENSRISRHPELPKITNISFLSYSVKYRLILVIFVGSIDTLNGSHTSFSFKIGSGLPKCTLSLHRQNRLLSQYRKAAQFSFLKKESTNLRAKSKEKTNFGSDSWNKIRSNFKKSVVV